MNKNSLQLLLTIIPLMSAQSFAACSLSKVAEFPVQIVHQKALLKANLDGGDARLIVDSGSNYSFLSAQGAAELKLKVRPTTQMRISRSLTHYEKVAVTTVKDTRLASARLGPDSQFLVVNQNMAADAAGALGQNILGGADVDFDVSKGEINLIKPVGCGSTSLGYVVSSASGPYHTINLELKYFAEVPLHDMGVTYLNGIQVWGRLSGGTPLEMMDPEHFNSKYAVLTVGTAYLNGRKILVRFDTGTSLSMLTLAAARRAGVTPSTQGVLPAGDVAESVQENVRSWVGPFNSFRIAGEETPNIKLRFGDFRGEGIDMIIGMDFFLSHHLYVANSQQRIYLASNGEPMFDVSAQPAQAATASGQ